MNQLSRSVFVLALSTFAGSAGAVAKEPTGEYGVPAVITLGAPLREEFSLLPEKLADGSDRSAMEYVITAGVKKDNATGELYLLGFATTIRHDSRGAGRGPDWIRAVRAGKVPWLNDRLRFRYLRRGDIFAASNGMVFEVTGLGGDSHASLRPVPRDRLDSRPVVEPDRRILVIDRGWSSFGGGYEQVTVSSEKRVDSAARIGDDERRVAVLHLFREPPYGSVLKKDTKELEIRRELAVGSEVQIAGVTHTVHSVVLPDPERKIVGWVEMVMPPFDEKKEAEAWEREQAMWMERWGLQPKPVTEPLRQGGPAKRTP